MTRKNKNFIDKKGVEKEKFLKTQIIRLGVDSPIAKEMIKELILKGEQKKTKFINDEIKRLGKDSPFIKTMIKELEGESK
jgi:Mn-dependent DtxR family transcriptional regulator